MELSWDLVAASTDEQADLEINERTLAKIAESFDSDHGVMVYAESPDGPEATAIGRVWEIATRPDGLWAGHDVTIPDGYQPVATIEFRDDGSVILHNVFLTLEPLAWTPGRRR